MRQRGLLAALGLLALLVAPTPRIVAQPADVAEPSLTFFVVSDFGRDGHQNQRAVAHAMGRAARNLAPQFILTAGDNFQEAGVESTADRLWQTSFERVYTARGLRVDWYPVLGNHDYRGHTQAEIDYSHIDRRWQIPARYYTFVKKIGPTASLRVVALDTTPLLAEYRTKPEEYPDVVGQSPRRQLAWLERTLATSKETWKIVVGHHPVYSSGVLHGDSAELIAKLRPLLERYGVDFYVAGHDHDFEHLQPPGGGTEYLVVGTGSSVRPVGSQAMTRFSRSVSGFAIGSVTSQTLTVRFVDVNGDVIYSTTRTRR